MRRVSVCYDCATVASASPMPQRTPPHGRVLTPVVVLAMILASCTHATTSTTANKAWTVPRSIADSIRTELLAPGVQFHHLVQLAAPWRAEVLDVDLNACVSVRSVKGSATAVGRATTSALFTSLPVADAPIAAVNADFFLFTPPGVPVGALMESGKLIAGPIERPVFAMTRAGRPWIGTMAADGRLQTTKGRITLETWNRPSSKVPGVVDANWGMPLDSLAQRGAWMLTPLPRDTSGPRYLATPAIGTAPLMARGDTLLIVGLASSAEYAAMLTSGDTVRVRKGLRPFQPREVVGGFPLLLRDSTVAGSVDSAGAVSFRALNPRTAIGYAAEGRRLLIVVIDGRQPGYSMGMTLRQTADLLRALGASEAMNLDGGGSSAMVARNTVAGAKPRVMNHPSDSIGERPVANALALLRKCATPQ